MPLDYASVLSAGRQLVPDLRQQMMQDEAMQMQREQFNWQRDQVERARQAALVESQEEAAYKEHLEQALLSGNPQDVLRLMARFPKMAEGVKPLWDAMDKGQRDADLTQAGTIYRRALDGDLAGAIGMMEQRVQADLAAKTPDAADQAILAGLRSDNPVEQKAAISSIGIYLAAAAGADKFGENYSRYFPSVEPTQLQRKVEYYRSEGRDDLAEQVLQNEATDIVVGQPGAPIMTKQQAIRFAQGDASTPEPNEPSGVGRDQPVSDGGAVIKGLFPDARITQVRRDPSSALGRANPSSYHNRTAAAVDVAPIPGMTFDQFLGRIRGAGHSIIESRDEVTNPSSHATGPHWHVVIGQSADTPVKVRSVQQARRLPAGTLIETPDGRTMRLR